MTSLPKVAAVLDFVNAAFQIMIFPLAFLSLLLDPSSGIGLAYQMMLVFVTVPLVSTGLMATVGGVFAWKRRQWGLAITGAVAAFLPLIILPSFVLSLTQEPKWVLMGLPGAIAIMLTVLAKKHFRI